jgi:gamma-tubulin complex component 2
MAGDSAVRSLLEKMTECASAAYLRMLERFVMVHNYLYGSFF